MRSMTSKESDVIIVGGSYAGLSAAMALGRALRRVLLIDGGKPANRYTPHSHNFLTQDGMPPGEIAALARQQVDGYPTVKRVDGFVIHAEKTDEGFAVYLASHEVYSAAKLIFATGITDLFPDIPGFEDCWGKTVLHCPYCHGYEVRGQKTAILGNGDYAFEFGTLISNWTSDLTILTNGEATLSAEQREKLGRVGISIVERKVEKLRHHKGNLEGAVFADGIFMPFNAIYARPEFRQHSEVPVNLGCALTPEGYIAIDSSHRASVPGVYACGDNVTRLRTVANAVSSGTTTGMMVNKDLVQESFAHPVQMFKGSAL